MFISVINLDKKRRRQIRASFVYALLSIFLLLFYYIYISYSFGEDSDYMHWMFLIPLIGGLVPSLLLLLMKKEHWISRTTFNLYNSSLACMIFGCLVRGIINISGRYTEYDKYYYYVAAAFLIIAFLSFLFSFFVRMGKISSD